MKFAKDNLKLENALDNIPYVFNADIGHVSPKMTMVNGAILHLTTSNTKGTIEFELK